LLIFFHQSETGASIIPRAKLPRFFYDSVANPASRSSAAVFAAEYAAHANSLFAGIFLVGALLAFGCGFVLLPVSIIGLVAILGLAGFTPFITCHVFLRHFLQAKTIARSEGHKARASLAFLLGIFLALAVPGLIYLVCGDNIAKIIEHIPWPSEATKFLGPD
jgi:NADH:ubiquinone oxidoreductase subunit 6 (subunit J)